MITGKISKKDQDPRQIDSDREGIERLLAMKSPHFTMGTRIVHNQRSGEIVNILTCKCMFADKALRVRWDDGSMSTIKPFALNPKGLGHG